MYFYRIRKVIIPFVVLLGFSTLFSQSTLASHAAGIELTYMNTGGLDYQFKLTLYRDCSGIAPHPTGEIHCVSSCGGGVVSCTVYLDSIIELPRTCPNTQTICNGGTVQGIEACYYSGFVTLPYSCNDWEFRLFDPVEQEYGICCRNPAVTNLDFASQYKIYVRATLDNLTFSGNNAPVFANPPVIFLCDQTPSFYNPGVFDLDGDSLSFQLVTPHSDTGTDVNYAIPFTAQQPISYTVPTSLDSITGDLFIHPNGIQVSVLTMRVNEYRNGILIGSTERDIQLIVENCNNALPAVSGINSTQTFSDTLVAGDTTCFIIYSSDQDSTDSLSLSWNQSIPSASFIVSPGQFPQGTFCWSPVDADTSASPYYFTVSVFDNHCPISGMNTFSYSIFVVPDTIATTVVNPNENSIFCIYPNPSTGIINIITGKEILMWSVYNSTGNCILNGKSRIEFLDLTFFAPGMYHVEGLYSDGKRFFSTLVKE